MHTPWGLFTGSMAVEALGFSLSTPTVHSHCPGSARGPARSSEQQNEQCTKHSENVPALKTASLAILKNSMLNIQSMQTMSWLGLKRHRGAEDKGPHRSGLGAHSGSTLASGHARVQFKASSHHPADKLVTLSKPSFPCLEKTGQQ